MRIFYFKYPTDSKILYTIETHGLSKKYADLRSTILSKNICLLGHGRPEHDINYSMVNEDHDMTSDAQHDTTIYALHSTTPHTRDSHFVFNVTILHIINGSGCARKTAAGLLPAVLSGQDAARETPSPESHAQTAEQKAPENLRTGQRNSKQNPKNERDKWENAA